VEARQGGDQKKCKELDVGNGTFQGMLKDYCFRDPSTQQAQNQKAACFEALFGNERSNTRELVVLKQLLEEACHFPKTHGVDQAGLVALITKNLKKDYDAEKLSLAEYAKKMKPFVLDDCNLSEALTSDEFADKKLLYAWSVTFGPYRKFAKKDLWPHRTEVDAAHCNGGSILYAVVPRPGLIDTNSVASTTPRKLKRTPFSTKTPSRWCPS